MVFDSRASGVLLHPTSLPGPFGIGSLGQEAYAFVDWLASSGATVWQILPLVPNGRDDSPYFSWTAFAGNWMLTDPRALVGVGLLDSTDLTDPFDPSSDELELAQVAPFKRVLLRKAASRFLDSSTHIFLKNYQNFCANNPWVNDTALYHILRYDVFNQPWIEWPEEIKQRQPKAISAAKKKYAREIAIESVLFFFFDQQWHDLKGYCQRKGIRILGDIPIYVDFDSCDVWMNTHLFKLDADLRPTVVSGVPPDYFSAEGQWWGNPIYRWDVMESEGFSWWKSRLERALSLCDVLRIDHFRGLAAYWEIPAQSARATAGYWVQGPGQKFIDMLHTQWPNMPFVAEDLGTLDAAVHHLRDDNGLPGMRILQFAFDNDPSNINLPHNHPEHCIVYTGTHDNQTIIGWRRELPLVMQHTVAHYFQMFDAHCHDDRYAWHIIESAFGSRARVAVIPVQDLLHLDDHARMNSPDTNVGNWRWRVKPGLLTEEIAQRLRHLGEKYHRL